jgi:hypothetical protein
MRTSKQKVRTIYRFTRLPENASQARPECTEDNLKVERAGLEKEAFRVITFYDKARLRLGQIFIRLKSTLKHGQWERYYERTFGDCGVSLRSAERYMRKAAKADRDSRNDSLTVLKEGTNSEAVKIRNATKEAAERVQAAVGCCTQNTEAVYRLALHLSAIKREATIRLWQSQHRPPVEKKIIAVLSKSLIEFGFVDGDALDGEDADHDTEAR